MLWKKVCFAGIICIAFSIVSWAAPIWSEDFSGINGQIQTDADWTGIMGTHYAGVARPYDRTNVMYALDTADNGSPMAYSRNMYSRVGAVYTTIPSQNSYQMTGFFWDEGYSGNSLRSVWTEVFLETAVDTTNDHWMARDYSDGSPIEYFNAWRLSMVRLETELLLEIWKYHDDNSRTKVASVSSSLPDSSTKFNWSFTRNGNQVDVSLGSASWSGTDADYNASIHDEVVVLRAVDNNPLTSEYQYGDFIDTGWGNLVMTPEPATIAVFGLGALLLRRSGKVSK